MTWALCLVAFAGCATVPLPPPEPPAISWEEKLGWIMRLEEQRLVRDSNPPPPAIISAATQAQPAVYALPAPSDLIRLLTDEEARVRRRAALALGRVGLAEAVEPLAKLLASDIDPEVRQMVAFALGLIGDAMARPSLLAALNDSDTLVQGRAAEALGTIANKADAPAVSEMTQRHVRGGALAGIAADDVTYPLAAAAEAARLGLYALVRLGSFDALAAAALDPAGQPASTWWPIAYALARLPDPRAAPALVSLLKTPGRFTAAFSARGLGAMKWTDAAPQLRQLVETSSTTPPVMIQAIRALAAMGDSGAVPALTRIVTDVEADKTVRLEAMTALGAVATTESLDLLLELMSDAVPSVRGLAMRAIARLDPDAFLSALSGLDTDTDWTVRTAQATALGSLPSARGASGLTVLLQDRDPRVIPAVLRALVAAQAPDVDAILTERLKADDFAIRTAAAEGLGERKVAAAGPALAEAYRAATGDSTYVARAAILTALNRVDPARAEPLLQEALSDRDWAVRVRTAALYRERGSVGAELDASIRPAPPGRPITPEELQTLIAPKFSPHAYLETDRGTIELELAILDAPAHVVNFAALARRGFFNGIAIHRVVADFVVQDGDPRGDGEGGPGYTLRDELSMRPYLRGTVGMALDWEDTGGSQFFITHSPQPHLDGRYTVFGHVVNGMEIVDQLVPGDIIREVRIWDGVSESR